LGPFHGAIAVPSVTVVVVVVVVVDIDAQAAYKNYCIDHNQILQVIETPKYLLQWLRGLGLSELQYSETD